ncbi:MAG: aminotransferase class V-fold PLP-dependent enzyme [Solirubrobacteraceae bacterium]
MSDPLAFRSHFPVLEQKAYLNAGTEGPVPRAAVQAVRERLERELTDGRSGVAFFDSIKLLATQLRDEYASVLGCEAQDVALTGSTTDGVNTVLSSLDLAPGDEILTSDEEHPGLLAPLGRARIRDGVKVRTVPFEELAGKADGSTRLIACSHVSWVSGKVADVAALVETGVPVLLDGAQGIGAVPVDVHEIGCDYYAASGQKWLCGPEGSGCLYVHRERREEMLVPWPGYGSLADPEHALDFAPAAGAARFDLGFPPGLRSAWALASLAVFAQAGWDWVHDHAATMAAALAERLGERGIEVLPRGQSTLVSWRVDEGAAAVERLAEAGVIVRQIAGPGVLRASAGAWTTEEDLDRLLEALTD